MLNKEIINRMVEIERKYNIFGYASHETMEDFEKDLNKFVVNLNNGIEQELTLSDLIKVYSDFTEYTKNKTAIREVKEMLLLITDESIIENLKKLSTISLMKMYDNNKREYDLRGKIMCIVESRHPISFHYWIEEYYTNDMIGFFY